MNETLNMTEELTEVTTDVIETVEEVTQELNVEPVVEVVKDSNHAGVIIGGLLFTAGVAGATFVLDKAGKFDGVKRKYYEKKATKAALKAEKYGEKLAALLQYEDDDVFEEIEPEE